VTVEHNGPKCGCGQPGHLEAVASGTAIARWVNDQIANGAETSMAGGGTVTARAVSKAAAAGDALARTALQRAGGYMGRGLADLLHMFNPSIIVIGGGVSRSGPDFWIPLEQTMRASVMSSHYLDNLTVVPARNGDDAGLLGALALARALRPE
jgi:glucokinase